MKQTGHRDAIYQSEESQPHAFSHLESVYADRGQKEINGSSIGGGSRTLGAWCRGAAREVCLWSGCCSEPPAAGSARLLPVPLGFSRSERGLTCVPRPPATPQMQGGDRPWAAGSRSSGAPHCVLSTRVLSLALVGRGGDPALLTLETHLKRTLGVQKQKSTPARHVDRTQDHGISLDHAAGRLPLPVLRVPFVPELTCEGSTGRLPTLQGKKPRLIEVRPPSRVPELEGQLRFEPRALQRPCEGPERSCWASSGRDKEAGEPGSKRLLPLEGARPHVLSPMRWREGGPTRTVSAPTFTPLSLKMVTQTRWNPPLSPSAPGTQGSLVQLRAGVAPVQSAGHRRTPPAGGSHCGPSQGDRQTHGPAARPSASPGPPPSCPSTPRSPLPPSSRSSATSYPGAPAGVPQTRSFPPEE